MCPSPKGQKRTVARAMSTLQSLGTGATPSGVRNTAGCSATPDVRAYVTRPFQAIGEEFGFWIHKLAIEDDHVHVFPEFPRKYAIARVVRILKSISASRAFARFPQLRRKLWSGELWEDGYAARTVGDKVTSDLIRRHIKRRAVDQATKRPELF